MMRLHIVDRPRDDVEPGSLVFTENDSLGEQYRRLGFEVETPGSLGVSMADAHSASWAFYEKIGDVDVGDRRLWELEASEELAPFLSFRISSQGPMKTSGLVPAVGVFYYKALLERLLERYPIRHIECTARSLVLNYTLRMLATGPGLSVQRRSVWFVPFVSALWVLAFQALKSSKAFLRFLWARAAAHGAARKEARILLGSISLDVQGDPPRDSLLESLRSECETEGIPFRIISFDYTKKLNLGLLRRAREFVPYEAYMRLRDFVALPLGTSIALMKWWSLSRRLEPEVFRDHAFNLWPFFSLNLMAYYVSHCADLALHERACRNMFRWTKPDWFVFSTEYSRVFQVAMHAAAHQRVRCASLQHSYLDESHVGYCFGSDSGKAARYRLPDLFLSYGERERSLLSRIHPLLSERTRPVGSLKFDLMLSRFGGLDSQDFAKRHGLGPAAPMFVIFCSLEPMPFYEAVMDSVSQLLDRHRDASAVFKLHPADRRITQFEGLSRRYCKRLVVTDSLPTYGLLWTADVVLVTLSSLLEESVALEKKVMVISWSDYLPVQRGGHTSQFVASNHEPSRLTEELEALLARESGASHLQYEAMRREFFTTIDGRSGKRALKCLQVANSHETQ